MYRVLIAEDEVFVRLGIKMSVEWEKMGMQVIADAANGQQAWDIYEKEHPDIILTDIKMPVMNGLEATRIIREEGASLPIIMQTAYAFSSDRENAMQAGASEVLVKPITVSALRGCLSSYFPEIKW